VTRRFARRRNRLPVFYDIGYSRPKYNLDRATQG
jgi:hypothetical protein